MDFLFPNDNPKIICILRNHILTIKIVSSVTIMVFVYLFCLLNHPVEACLVWGVAVKSTTQCKCVVCFLGNHLLWKLYTYNRNCKTIVTLLQVILLQLLIQQQWLLQENHSFAFYYIKKILKQIWIMNGTYWTAWQERSVSLYIQINWNYLFIKTIFFCEFKWTELVVL